MNANLTAVKQWLANHAGLDPDLLDRSWIDRLLRARLKECGVSDEAGYCRVLESDEGERQRIIGQVSVNETWFFRYPRSFGLLVKHLASLRNASPAPAELVMFSVACASGQEPYSMVMAAAEAGWPLHQVRVDAVDRNSEAIDIAQTAEYPQSSLRADAPGWAKHWLTVTGDLLRVRREVTERVHFVLADILTAPDTLFPSRYDIVFCRNLLIYFHEAARRALSERLARWLAPGGLVFTGHAERFESLREHFEFVADPYTFALRGRSEQRSGSDLPATAGVLKPATGVYRPRDAKTTRRSSHRDASPTPATSGPSTAAVIQQARLLADHGQLSEALQLLEANHRHRLPSAAVFELLGSIYLGLEQTDLAREAFVKLLYLQPDHEDALLQLASIHQRLGQNERAARYRQRAASAHRLHTLEQS